MSIITLGEIEKLKLYKEVEQEYRTKRREMQHNILQKMEGTFVYGIGFDNIERLDVEDDSVESYFNVGKLYFRKEDLMRDWEDIYNVFMDAEYIDDQINPFLTDSDLICISIKIKLYCVSTLPMVYVCLGFETLGEFTLMFTVNYSDEYDDAKLVETDNKPRMIKSSTTCSSDKIEEYICWFYEHDVFKL